MLPSIKVNYFFKLLYQILCVSIPFVTVPYISRVLGPDEIGTFSFLQSLSRYFVIFASLGTLVYGSREISRVRDNKEKLSKCFWEIELLVCITSVVACGLWCVLIFYYPQERDNCLAFVPLILAVPFDISWFYTGIEKIYYTVIWNFVTKILILFGIFIFVTTKEDLFNYIFLLSISILIGNISMWFFLKREICNVEMSSLNIFRHFIPTLKYFITAIAISIYTVLDKTMIGLFTNSSAENGYYEMATKVIALITPFAFSALNDVMAPRMAFLFAKKNISEVKIRINNSLNIELLLSIGCVFGIIAVSPNFVLIFLGEEFIPVIFILQVLSLILIPICISTCCGNHYYIPSGKVFVGTRYIFIGAIVNVLINPFFIIKLGALGAVFASIVAESIIAFLYMRGAAHYLNLKFLLRSVFKKIVSGIAMLFIVKEISFIDIWIVYELCIQISIGVVVYFSILILLKDKSVFLILNFIKNKLSKES